MMVPTNHLRMFTQSVHEPAFMQQLWVDESVEDAHKKLPEQLVRDHAAQWIDIPVILDTTNNPRFKQRTESAPA